MDTQIQSLEKEILEKQQELAKLKRTQKPEKINDYPLVNREGSIPLSKLFGPHKELIVIHNMGKSCSYCTMWADGFNGLYDHLASRAAFIVVSPDDPKTQDEFAKQRHWKFPMYSGRGSTFIEDMGFKDKENGWNPGVSTFYKEDNGELFRGAQAPFDSFDPFCSSWHFFALLRDGVGDWQPKQN